MKTRTSPRTQVDRPQEVVHDTFSGRLSSAPPKCAVCLKAIHPKHDVHDISRRRRTCSSKCRRLFCSARQIAAALAAGEAEGLREVPKGKERT